MVQDNPKYRWGGGVTNLEKNYHVMAGIVPGFNGAVLIEELNLASLLWDLYNKNIDSGDQGFDSNYKDYINLGKAGVWKAINKKNITNIYNLYTSLKKDNIGQKDSNNNNISDLDELFIIHDFYSDKSKNGRWDKGELVGYPDAWNSRGAKNLSPRMNLEPINGTSINIKSSFNGQDYNVSIYKVVIVYENGEGNYDYLTNVIDGKIRIIVPKTSVDAKIYPVIAGFKSEPLVLTYDKFVKDVILTQSQNRDVFLDYTFKLKNNDLEKPTAQIINVSNNSISFSFESDYNIVVLRGVTPIYNLDEGVLLYNGNDLSFYNDENLNYNVTYYYSIFAVNDNVYSAPIIISATTGEKIVNENLISSTMMLIILFVIIVILFLFFKKSKKGNKKEEKIIIKKKHNHKSKKK